MSAARRVCGLALAAAAFSSAAGAQSPANDPNLANPTQVVTAQRDGYTIAALVTHAAGAQAGFKHGVALFPGHPGVMRLREENGAPRFDMGGNFLVRSRRHWLDADTLVAVIDAPSDQWNTFSQRFRETERYGADVAAVVEAIGKQFKVQDWTYVGTSEGSVSAFHAARMNPVLASRVILTASVFRAGRNGPGLSSARFEDLKAKLLWVHHEDDPCEYTLYTYAKDFARKSGAPLVTVRGGGPSRGADCQAFTAHGFVGMEREAVIAMRTWIQTGTVPADVRGSGAQ